MAVGYSGKPLIKKLGLQDNMRIYIHNNPGAEYENELGQLPSGVISVKRPEKDLDFIHMFTKSLDELKARLPEFVNCIKPSGMIWISWPKKASKISTDLTENVIRDFALTLKLVDIKVCAVTEIWSGLKLVIRKENRQKV